MGRYAASLDFVDSSEVVRPHRTDRTFTWKERDFNVHDATYRIEVTVLGNEVGGYREYLKVPEQWTRDYQKLRSKNEAASDVDSVVTLVLAIGMLVMIVMRVRRHDVPWRRAAFVGIAGMVLGFLAQLNEFPLREFAYPTTDSYGSFVSRQLLQAILAALGSGGLLFVLAAGAEPLYREAFREQISLGHLFTPRGLRTKRFLLGSILGITLTGIFIAYQTAFYIVAYQLRRVVARRRAVHGPAEYEVPVGVRAVRRLPPGGERGVSVPHVRDPVSAKGDAQLGGGAGAGGIHLGLRTRSVSAAAVLSFAAWKWASAASRWAS